jgi:hypothetical protein
VIPTGATLPSLDMPLPAETHPPPLTA